MQKLEKNARYQGTITLSGVGVMAANQQIVDELQSIGFSNVTVSGTGKVRTAQGVWPQATQNIQIPGEVKTPLGKIKIQIDIKKL